MRKLAIVYVLLVAACHPAKHSPTTGGGPPTGQDQPPTVIGSDGNRHDSRMQPPNEDPTACPSIQIKAPDSISAGTQARVTAITVDGGGTPSYNWKVSAGKIVSGQGTNMILVDTTGLSGASVLASLELGNLPKTCATTNAQATILVGP